MPRHLQARLPERVAVPCRDRMAAPAGGCSEKMARPAARDLVGGRSPPGRHAESRDCVHPPARRRLEPAPTGPPFRRRSARRTPHRDRGGGRTGPRRRLRSSARHLHTPNRAAARHARRGAGSAASGTASVAGAGSTASERWSWPPRPSGGGHPRVSGSADRSRFRRGSAPSSRGPRAWTGAHRSTRSGTSCFEGAELRVYRDERRWWLPGLAELHPDGPWRHARAGDRRAGRVPRARLHRARAPRTDPASGATSCRPARTGTRCRCPRR